MTATNVQMSMIRKIRGLDTFAALEDLTVEQAIAEIKAAMAAGFDPKKAMSSPAKAAVRPARRNGRCTVCFSTNHNCGCDEA